MKYILWSLVCSRNKNTHIPLYFSLCPTQHHSYTQTHRHTRGLIEVWSQVNHSMPVSTHDEPTKCALNKWLKWTQWRSRGPIIHCCPYKKDDVCGGWTDEFQSNFLSSCRSTTHGSQVSFFQSGSFLCEGLCFPYARSYIMKILQIPGGQAEHNSGSVQHLILWPHLLSSHLGHRFCCVFVVCFIVWSKMCPRCEIKYNTSIEAPAEVKKCQREVTEDSLKPHLSLFWSTLGQAVDVWEHTIKALINEDTTYSNRMSTWSQWGGCRQHI